MAENAELNALSMTELINIYNDMAESNNLPLVEGFKTLEAGREAVDQLQRKVNAGVVGGALQGTTAEAAGIVTNGSGEPVAGTTDDGKQQKYNSSDKRGPNQGVGAFAKEQIVAGKTNAEILQMIQDQMPTAKTTASCIAFYRSQMNKQAKEGVSGGDTPASLRKKAAELLAKADALEKALAHRAASSDLEAQVRAEFEAAIQEKVKKLLEERQAAAAQATASAGEQTTGAETPPPSSDAQPQQQQA